MKRITEEWLNAAYDDLRVIDKMRTDPLLTHMIAFHAQQCIEKSLKAILEEYGVGAIRVHNLERLIELVRDRLELELDIVLLEKLDKLYVDSRYPGEFGLLPDGKPTLEESEKFYHLAKTSCDIISQVFPINERRILLHHFLPFLFWEIRASLILPS